MMAILTLLFATRPWGKGGGPAAFTFFADKLLVKWVDIATVFAGGFLIRGVVDVLWRLLFTEDGSNTEDEKINNFAGGSNFNGKGYATVFRGQENPLRRLKVALNRANPNMLLLVDWKGGGKRHITRELARRFASDVGPLRLQSKRFYWLKMNKLLVNCTAGELSRRLHGIFENPAIDIFCIDEIHLLFKSAGGELGAVKAILADAKQRGKTVIGSLSPFDLEDLKTVIETVEFDVVRLEVMSPECTLQVLRDLEGLYERGHGVPYSLGALKACVAFSSKYFKIRSNPGMAIELMDYAGVLAEDSEVEVGQYHVSMAVFDLTGMKIPVKDF
ncbi:hypothetical protein M885DRAFT_564438 [Pelagophyceae sp. CCMP2097]|nr:hypothetical protein M885DRAFT_564438 [Pelagophyceae sp. CCMP2097]